MQRRETAGPNAGERDVSRSKDDDQVVNQMLVIHEHATWRRTLCAVKMPAAAK